MKFKKIITLVSISCANLAFAAYPDKPIKLIVPFANGGTTDLVVNAVLEPLSKELGQELIVENMGGQGGSLGTIQLANSENDGYTIGISTISTHASNPAYQQNIGYNPIDDFTHIGNIASTPNIISVNQKFAGSNYKDFLNTIKNSKGGYSYATPGLGGTHHLLMEKFKFLTKTSLTHIPYRGAGPALKDVSLGRVDIMFDNLPSSLNYIKDGSLKPIAIGAPDRFKSLPNVPTFKELGLEPINRMVFFGVVAPSGVPDEAVKKINEALKAVLSKPEVQEKIQELGGFTDFKTPEEQKKLVFNEYNEYLKIIKEQKISSK